MKSKQRIRDVGEVFTQEREVNAMLDLVKNETERIESKFLEPACGDGNFLAPILQRKIEVVRQRYKRSKLEYERNALMAIGSVYGVDIMSDNVEECRERLYKIFEKEYMDLYKKRADVNICLSAKSILKYNILQGDALTLKNSDNQPIQFSDWSRPRNNSLIKRHEYIYEEMVTRDEPSILKTYKVSDEGKTIFQVRPVKSHPLVHMTKLGAVDGE